jgi:O-antigen ligase
MGCALAAIVAIVSPKFASVMIWPILFLYPHNWWYQRGFLPLNIGGDDLFCLLLFLGVVIRRNLISGLPIRMGYAFWGITAFTIIAAVANTVGYLEVAGGNAPDALKSAFKPAVYWALFYAILHCVDDPRDLKAQLWMFSVAAAFGAALVVMQNYVPGMLSAFAQPRPFSTVQGLTHESRGAGAFLNPNAAACVLGCSVLLSMAVMRLDKRALYKIFTCAVIVLLLIGILYTRSRSGLIGLVVTVLLMAVFSRGRKVTLLVILAGIGVAVFFAEARGLFGERLREAYALDTGTPGENLMGRMETWRVYLTESSAMNYLVGQGAAAGVAKFGMESHNAYISLLTLYGVSGAFWAVAMLVGFLRRARSSLRSQDPVICAAASGCVWTLVFWGIYSCTADAISSSYTRYLLFYLVVLLDRAHALFRQECGAGSETPALRYGSDLASLPDAAFMVRRC